MSDYLRVGAHQVMNNITLKQAIIHDNFCQLYEKLQ
jgi:hypothetical protein